MHTFPAGDSLRVLLKGVVPPSGFTIVFSDLTTPFLRRGLLLRAVQPASSDLGLSIHSVGWALVQTQVGRRKVVVSTAYMAYRFCSSVRFYLIGEI